MSATEQNIIDFLVNDLLYDKDLDKLAPSDPLIEGGLLDSLGVMRVVSFCEETFGIELADTDVVPENFETVSAIAKLIDAKQK
jgi:acyl carrier protein